MAVIAVRSAAQRISLLSCVAILAGCAESIGTGVETPEATLQPVSSQAMTGVPGLPLVDSISVRVVDPEGKPVVGVEVQFVPIAGNGAVSPDKVLSSETGAATTQWVLGPAAGENKLQVKIGSAPDTRLDFTALAQWGRESRIEVVSAPTSVMPVGCELPQPLVVRVRDSAGAPVPDAPVYFSSGAGGTTVRSDASGNASLRWRATAASQRVVAKIASPNAATVAFEVQAVPIAPNGYASIGNRIISSACAEHRFIGMARPGLQWWPDDERLSNAELAKADFTKMREWGANIIRLPVYQRYWLMNYTSGTRTYTAEAYRSLVRATVERANAAGLDVMIDLHASDRGDPNFAGEVPEIQQMADENHSIPFWHSVAEMFKDNGRVIFQLYNEPNQISWEVWRNGGMIPGGVTIPGSTQSSGIPFKAAGMQALYNAVREKGANNMVVINGMHWGYDLARATEYAISGHNVMYATHPYDYPDKQPDQWENAWGYLADSFPVMIAEFGDYTCNANGYYTKVLDYADRKKMSWIAWAWWAPPANRPDQICGFPALIEDWAGTPSPTGKIIRARMQSYR